MPVFGQKPDTGYSSVRRRDSLWRFLSPISLAAKKSARRRRRDDGAKSRRKRRIRRRLEVSPLRRGREQDEGYFAPAGATFFRSAAKEGKGAPEGTYFEAVPSGLPPRRPRGLRPHWIPHFWTKDGGLRGTKDKGQRTGDEGCRTRNTAGPVGRFDRQAPMHWNHTTLFFPLPNRSPAGG